MTRAEAIHQTFVECGTDKSVHQYAETYARVLPPFEQVAAVLELGVYHGGSLRAWLRLFPNAVVGGIDVTMGFVPPDVRDCPRVVLMQGDFRVLDVVEDAKYDVIVEDMNHHPADQIDAFLKFWPHVKAGGVYVIEDVLSDGNADDIRRAAQDRFGVEMEYVVISHELHSAMLIARR